MFLGGLCVVGLWRRSPIGELFYRASFLRIDEWLFADHVTDAVELPGLWAGECERRFAGSSGPSPSTAWPQVGIKLE